MKLEDPVPLKLYLGCTHKLHNGQLSKEARAPGSWLPIEGYMKVSDSNYHKVRCMEYDMSSFVAQCVSSYLEVTGSPVTKLSASGAIFG